MKTEKKTSLLFAAVTPGTRERVAQLAAARGFTISAFIRHLALRELRAAEQE